MTKVFLIHGNFEMLNTAWSFVWLAFNDATWKSLAYVIFTFGVTISAFGGAANILHHGGGKFDGWRVKKTLFMGVLMYNMLLSSSGTIILEDDVTAKTATYANIPIGIVAIAGTINVLTVGIEEEIEALAVVNPPISRAESGYGQGFRMLKETGYKGALSGIIQSLIDASVRLSFQKYSEDCIALVAANSPNILTQLRTATSQDAAWQLAAHPSLYVETYLDAAGASINNSEFVTCQTAYNRIHTFATSTTVFTTAINDFCAIMNFDTSDGGVTLAQCKTALKNTSNEYWLGDGLSDTSHIAENAFFAESWNSYLSSVDSSILQGQIAAYNQTASSLSSAGLMAQEWMPVTKNVFLMIIIGLLPILFMFLLTQFSMDVIKFIFGIFIFWGMWCVVDTLIECFWLQQMTQTFQSIEKSQFGTMAFEKMWTYGSKSLAMLGSMRSFAMLIASTITFGIFKFGGSAMGQLGGKMVGTTSGGTATASSYMSSAGEGLLKQRSAEMDTAVAGAYFSSPSEVRRNANRGVGFDTMAQHIGRGQFGHEITSSGGNISGAASTYGSGQMYNFRQTSGNVEAMNLMGQAAVQDASKIGSLMNFSDAKAWGKQINQHAQSKGLTTLGAIKDFSEGKVANTGAQQLAANEEWQTAKNNGWSNASNLNDYMQEKIFGKAAMDTGAHFANMDASKMLGGPANAAYQRTMLSAGSAMSSINNIFDKLKAGEIGQKEAMTQLTSSLGKFEAGATLGRKDVADKTGLDQLIDSTKQQIGQTIGKNYGEGIRNQVLKTGEGPSQEQKTAMKDLIANTPGAAAGLQDSFANMKMVDNGDGKVAGFLNSHGFGGAQKGSTNTASFAVNPENGGLVYTSGDSTKGSRVSDGNTGNINSPRYISTEGETGVVGQSEKSGLLLMAGDLSNGKFNGYFYRTDGNANPVGDLQKGQIVFDTSKQSGAEITNAIMNNQASSGHGLKLESVQSQAQLTNQTTTGASMELGDKALDNYRAQIDNGNSILNNLNARHPGYNVNPQSANDLNYAFDHDNTGRRINVDPEKDDKMRAIGDRNAAMNTLYGAQNSNPMAKAHYHSLGQAVGQRIEGLLNVQGGQDFQAAARATMGAALKIGKTFNNMVGIGGDLAANKNFVNSVREGNTANMVSTAVAYMMEHEQNPEIRHQMVSQFMDDINHTISEYGERGGKPSSESVLNNSASITETGASLVKEEGGRAIESIKSGASESKDYVESSRLWQSFSNSDAGKQISSAISEGNGKYEQEKNLNNNGVDNREPAGA